MIAQAETFTTVRIFEFQFAIQKQTPRGALGENCSAHAYMMPMGCPAKANDPDGAL
ncbi:MAG: hypothetical protein ACOX1A_00355 [Saccharofermentanales bacterium]